MRYQPRPQSNTFSKARRAFGDPVSSLKPKSTFVPIPLVHQMPADLTYDAAAVLGNDKINAINSAGKIVFQMVGDTGGINGTDVQDELAVQMEQQVTSANAPDQPAFFYHLGDVIYYNGQSQNYKPQFYEPYQYYPAPIFAIPGNHDGDNVVQAGDPPDTEPSLTGFFDNFCAAQRVPSPNSPYRYVMDQPWPYWTLKAPFVTIIGLYSNVEGNLDDPGSPETDQTQYNWLIEQLRTADASKGLLLAVHHPPFSLDTAHGGYQDILDAIDQATKAAGRVPDAVFTGHVHNYQRFTRTVNGKQIPYVIAGAGGYARTQSSMHQMQTDPKTADGRMPDNFQTTHPDVVMATYNAENPGFLNITVDGTYLTGAYYINTFGGGTLPSNPFDTFKLNWKTGKLEGI